MARAGGRTPRFTHEKPDAAARAEQAEQALIDVSDELKAASRRAAHYREALEVIAQLGFVETRVIAQAALKDVAQLGKGATCLAWDDERPAESQARCGVCGPCKGEGRDRYREVIEALIALPVEDNTYVCVPLSFIDWATGTLENAMIECRCGRVIVPAAALDDAGRCDRCAPDDGGRLGPLAQQRKRIMDDLLYGAKPATREDIEALRIPGVENEEGP